MAELFGEDSKILMSFVTMDIILIDLKTFAVSPNLNLEQKYF